jgi:hypothetical protein
MNQFSILMQQPARWELGHPTTNNTYMACQLHDSLWKGIGSSRFNGCRIIILNTSLNQEQKRDDTLHSALQKKHPPGWSDRARRYATSARNKGIISRRKPIVQ